MSTPPILCEQCQTREARVHLTQITDGVRRSHDWCEECYGQGGPPEIKEYMNTMAAVCCKYCGGKPCVAPAILLSQPTLVGKKPGQEFLCETCFRESTNLFLQWQDRVESGPLEERTSTIHEFLAELENHLIRAAKQRSQEPPEK